VARQGPWRTSRPLKRSPWVLEAIEDRDVAEVRASLERIIAPAEAKASELRSAR